MADINVGLDQAGEEDRRDRRQARSGRSAIANRREADCDRRAPARAWPGARPGAAVARPPSQTPIAATWMTLTGKFRATGDWVLPWPGERGHEDDEGERAAASEDQPDADSGRRRSVTSRHEALLRQRRRRGARRGRRGPRSSRTWFPASRGRSSPAGRRSRRSPAASAPSITTPAAALIAPSAAPVNSITRSRLPNARAARDHASSPPPTSSRAGSQARSRKTSAPTARATAAYWSARAAPKAISVTVPRAGVADQLGDRLVRSGSRPSRWRRRSRWRRCVRPPIRRGRWPCSSIPASRA